MALGVAKQSVGVQQTLVSSPTRSWLEGAHWAHVSLRSPPGLQPGSGHCTETTILPVHPLLIVCLPHLVSWGLF